MKHPVLIALIVFAAFCCSSQAEKPLFSENAYEAHLKFLADDLLEGRSPGARGGDLAALYIAGRFEEAGLLPISKEDGYYQKVPLHCAVTEYGSATLTLSSQNHRLDLKPVEEALINSELPDEEIRLDDELLFCGYGIEAPEFGRDDFKGIDIKNRVVVMLCGEPDFEKTGFPSESLTYYGTWTYKEEICRLKGAKGLILLHSDKLLGIEFPPIRNVLSGGHFLFESQMTNLFALYAWITEPALNKALAPAGLSFDQLIDKAESPDFTPVPLGLRVEASFRQRRRELSSPNVIGYVPGTSMDEEAIVIMAHYDHLGIGPEVEGDSIYNGAYDNASGMAGLICLAQAFAKHPAKRRLIFLATTFEEKRMRFGSEYYVAHPLVPLDKTVIALNMDGLELYGRGVGFRMFPIQFTDAVPTAERLAEEMGLKLQVDGPDRAGSTFLFDNHPFIAHGVVALRLRLAGDYETRTLDEVEELEKKIGPTYHQPNDEIYPFFRYDGAIQELEILTRVARFYADGAQRPSMIPEHPFAVPEEVRRIKVLFSK